jgi:hypothetical protein
LELTATGGTHGSQTVAISAGMTFAHLLHKVKEWNKGKTQIENMEDDRKGMNWRRGIGRTSTCAQASAVRSPVKPAPASPCGPGLKHRTDTHATDCSLSGCNSLIPSGSAHIH